MTIQIFTVGGYQEIGRNMTAVKVDDDVIILDIGLHLEHYIQYSDDDNNILTVKTLGRAGAIPNVEPIEHLIKNVRAIIPSHAHLDHCGAIPFLANHFNAEVLCTPFTKNVLDAIITDQKKKLKKKIIGIPPNHKHKINENITIELINVTHSTPQTSIIAVHTRYGTILYANDFKLDETPTLGEKTNLARLKEIGNSGKVICLIMECLYADMNDKMPSELIAKQMLEQAVEECDKDNALIITTFSSHIARLKTIKEIAKKHKRKPVFLGRSMHKYIMAAEDTGLINFKDSEVINFKSLVKKKLRKIMQDGKEKYLIVCTGHQGEKRSVLYTIMKQEGFLEQGDVVIFSSNVIPTETTIKNREEMEIQRS